MRERLEVTDTRLGAAFVRFDARSVARPDLALFDPATPALHAQPVSEGGRQAAWYVRCGELDAVLRHYRRGGLAARVSTDRYLWAGMRNVRSLNEFDVLRTLYETGLPVPRPLAAAFWRHGLTYRAAILVERLHGVKPLASALDVADSEQVARTIYAMHEQGVWHADLNAYNILLDEEGRAWLIDFDKARRMVLSPEKRSANLLRLRRSLAKVAGAQGMTWWDDLNLSYTQLLRAVGM
ncbi:MAG TPA: 3-deoxy-D-manno-octulosonic acid kinase [Burkholderiaceae bacterium]|nr:3-deoxy-D-manno-octulosonic acid kinase [bacterium SGD-2]HZH57682.1 3-deoxy-D-manno-octulosonic acid kinase [Burkholderiaceae bacterium]